MLTIDNARETWKQLYTDTLPSLARAKDSAQYKWPVTLDHCFARIILDNTIGKGAGSDGQDVQWDSVLSKPAIKHMSQQQLHTAIEMAEKIRKGEIDLVELDKRSLEARGKSEGKYKSEKASNGTKRKRITRDEEAVPRNSPQKKQKQENKSQSTLGFAAANKQEAKQLPSPAASGSEVDASTDPNKDDRSILERDLETTSQPTRAQIRATLARIQTHPTLTPFRKRLYTALLSVPRGQYTTYAAMAADLNSVARAVGNGMRNNPFAPDVPCHRVLASDGTIGGFCGDWNRDGTLSDLQNKKVRLLAEEGVRFDSRGKVRGPVWKGFWDLKKFEEEYGKVG